MTLGIAFGFITAILNSIGYLVSARYLLHYKSPLRLLIQAQVFMMVIALPFLVWLFPFGQIDKPLEYAGVQAFWVTVFLLGQGCFFAAQRYFEASRLSSLLGLKIIVLAILFVASGKGMLNLWQVTAVLMAAIAGMLFNWSGAARSSLVGWLLVVATLFCYSFADLSETELVIRVHASGHSLLHSTFATAALAYTALGAVSLPFIYRFRPTRDQICKVFPYSLIWLTSQVSLFACFAMIKPVFGNVILATRGLFSVVFGALLPFIGLASLDSKISRRKWIQRGFAALLMALAIAIYSYGKSLQQ